MTRRWWVDGTAAGGQDAGDGHVSVAVGEAEQHDLAGAQNGAMDADDLGAEGRCVTPADGPLTKGLGGQASLLAPASGSPVVPCPVHELVTDQRHHFEVANRPEVALGQ